MREGKHSKKAILPNKGDIKDGLLKMILYSNLSEVTVNGEKVNSEGVLSLTSSKLKGKINSTNTQEAIFQFFVDNKFSKSQKILIETIIEEANENNFIVKIQFSK